MKDWKFWWTCPLMIFVGIVGPGLAGQAHADTGADAAKVERIVCTTLDSYPSVGGVAGIGQALENEGLTAAEAADVILLSARNYCPEYLPLLAQIGSQYGGSQVA